MCLPPTAALRLLWVIFFLEKGRFRTEPKVGIPLEKEADKQVISYALSKRIPFAVSTNFEELKIFCVEQENAIKNVFRVFNEPDDYLKNYEDLLFLSKESFEQNLTLKKAESEGRLKKRVSIDKQLLNDLMHIRSLIASDLEKSYSDKYTANEKDEIIQRIIDRLIFIRRCEDIGINPDNLMIEEIRRLPDNKAYPKLKELFTKYNATYNSGLFAVAVDNDCDKIDINGAIIKKLAYYLYESKEQDYIYNFDWIDADVLGQVYEQYLGKILAQTKSGKAKLKDGQAHRKEQGIYYTPTYIVDYIVKNTVGELLKDKSVKAKDIKILDPACGSGSFLIKAFDYLYAQLSATTEHKQHKIDSQGSYSLKTEILKHNLYGVDLDNKAVEITKLNLLLKAAEKNRKLPEEMDIHIRHGNSLIDDSSIAGLNAFKWIKDFEEMSFDIVIGNPPYGIVFNDDEKKYLEEKYSSFKRNNDLYVVFIEKSIKLLREGGYFSFIVPNTYLIGSYFDGLKKFILEKTVIIKIINLGRNQIFQDPNVFNSIIILKKESNKYKRIKNNLTYFDVPLIENLDIVKLEKNSIEYNILQQQLDDLSWKPKNKILEKLNKNRDKEINDLCYVKDVGLNYWSIGRGKKRGDSIGSRILYDGTKQNTKDIPYLKGRDIIKYGYLFGNHWLKNDYNTYLHKNDIFRFSSEFLEQTPKIVYRQTADKIIATIDCNKYFLDKTVHLIVPKENVKMDLVFLLGILNSKLIAYYYHQLVGEEGRTFAQVKTVYIKQIPIKFNSEIENSMSILVKQQLNLTENLINLGNKKTSQIAKIETDIIINDKEIDELVYKLYGITKEEQKIIEDSFK